VNKPRAFIFIPGIRHESEGIDGWPDQAVLYVHTHTKHRAEKYEYSCKALTRWLGQSRRIEDVARLIWNYRDFDVSVAAHSNGCAIAIAALQKFPQAQIDTLHLFAAAADPDWERNGLNEAIEDGRCERVYCYCSEGDRVLKLAGFTTWLRRLGLGYGQLGLIGPQNVSKVGETATYTDWNNHFGHSTYFHGSHFGPTVRLIIQR
jgi:pimeloyl-ACP methyl ester carboxylesterase